MDEPILRALVRDALSRHIPEQGTIGRPVPVAERRACPADGLLSVPAGSDSGGACLIEPTVSCTRCGYCRSLGH